MLQKLTDNKPVDSTRKNDEPELTIMRKLEVRSRDKNSLSAGGRESNETNQKIPEEKLMQTTLRRKKVSLKEEAEEIGIHRESGEWLLNDNPSEAQNLSEEPDEWEEVAVESEDEQDILCTIL